MSTGPLTNRTIYNMDPTSVGLSLKPNAKIDDPKLTTALRKLLNGESLTSQDEKVLTDTFNHTNVSETIPKLKKYLNLKEDHFNDSTTKEDLNSFDQDTFQEVKPDDLNSLGQKQDNFREEFKAAKDRLIKLLGNDDKAKESPLIKEINSVLDSMSGGIKNDGPDSFSAQVSKELTSRLQAQSKVDSIADPHAQANASPTKFSGLTNDELAWVIKGGTAVPAPELAGLVKQTETKQEFKLDDIPSSSDIKKWHGYLKFAEQNLLATSQNQARSLLRNLQNLEELKDPEAIKDLLTLNKNIPITNEIVVAYQDKFNEAIKKLKTEAKNKTIDLKDYEFDKELHASLEAEMTTLPSFPASSAAGSLKPEEERQLSRALNFLESNASYNPNKPNTDIKKAIDKLQLTDKLKGKTPAEQKLFLTKVLNKMKHEEQEKALASLSADLDPATADPTVFFDRFKDSVESLYKHIENRAKESPESLKRLEQEMVRFMRSGELTTDLANEFKNKPELAKALNYFSHGRGDSPMNIGLVKSLFTYENAEDDVKAFNIRDIVAASSNMDQVANKIEEAIAFSAKSPNHQIPDELFDKNASAKTYYLLSAETFEPEYTHDDKGKPIKTDHYKLFDELGLTAYMKNDEKHPIIIKDRKTLEKFPKELKELMKIAYAPKDMSDSKITEILTSKEGDVRIADYDEKTGKLSFVDNGSALMVALKEQILKKETQYAEYNSYDPKQTMTYAEIRETRDKLIEFSEDHHLGIFEKHKIPQAFHKAEYKEALNNFAVNIDYLKEHVKANIIPQETSSNTTYFGYSRATANNTQSNPSSYEPVESVNDYTTPGTRNPESYVISEMNKQFEKILDIIGADDSSEEDDENADKDDLFHGIINPFDTNKRSSYNIYS